MLVGVCMPCAWNRCSFCTFDFLANDNTCVFRPPLWRQSRRLISCVCQQRSWRLFLNCLFLVTSHQTSADVETGIPVGISTHRTCWTKHQGRTGGIPFLQLPLRITSNKALATSTFPTGLPGTHSTRDDPFVPRLVLRVFEDAPLHPEGPFGVSAMAILAPGRLEIAQLLKHQDASLSCLCKLDNASTDQMRVMVIASLDFLPEVSIVLFVLGDHASLVPVACDPS